MSARTSPMDRRQMLERATVARSFLKAAQNLHTISDGDVANAIASDAVLSGIAAADVICAAALGVHATGDHHSEAVQLLKTVAPSGPEYAKDLKRLLDAKSTVQYSSNLAAPSLAIDCLKWAQRLIAGMERELRGLSR